MSRSKNSPEEREAREPWERADTGAEASGTREAPGAEDSAGARESAGMWEAAGAGGVGGEREAAWVQAAGADPGTGGPAGHSAEPGVDPVWSGVPTAGSVGVAADPAATGAQPGSTAAAQPGKPDDRPVRTGARVTVLHSAHPTHSARSVAADADDEVEVDLSVDLAGVKLPNPVLAASGTFGFGREMAQHVDLSQVGAVVTKSVSAAPRRGRPTPRMAETPSGMLNAIGLQNPGVEAYCANELPFLAAAGARVVASIFGHTAAEFGAVAGRLAHEPAIDLLEVNLSCPNVEHHGRLFAADPEAAATVVREVKERAGVPVLAKLSADVTDVVPVAAAAVDAGADGLVLINTVLGMAVDVRRRRPKLAAVTGGLSGPAIRPIALRCVWQVVQSLPGVPVVGIGGITCAEDAAEFLLVGATAVAVGTASLINPTATTEIADGLAGYLRSVGVDSVAALPATFTRW